MVKINSRAPLESKNLSVKDFKYYGKEEVLRLNVMIPASMLTKLKIRAAQEHRTLASLTIELLNKADI